MLKSMLVEVQDGVGGGELNNYSFFKIKRERNDHQAIYSKI